MQGTCVAFGRNLLRVDWKLVPARLSRSICLFLSAVGTGFLVLVENVHCLFYGGFLVDN